MRPLPRSVFALGAAALAAVALSQTALSQTAESQTPESQATGAQETVREARRTLVEVAPRVLDVRPDRVVLAWITSEASVGRLSLVGPGGEKVLEEPAPTRYHRVEAEGLAPGATYRYLVDGRFSGSFRTPREEGPFKFAVFGHPGGSMASFHYPTSMLASTLVDVDPDFVLCTGDACFYTSEESFKELYFDVFRRVLAERPIYLTAANHEIGFPETRDIDYSLFRKLFPRDFPHPEFPFYSFVRGNVEFFAFAYGPMTKEMTRAQYQWLEESLQASRAEFRVVFMGGANEPRGFDRARLFKTAAENGADLVLGGDGVGYKTETHGGVDFLFAGANSTKQSEFFLVTAEDYRLEVARYQAPMGALRGSWTFPSQRPKTIVKDVLDGLTSVVKSRIARSAPLEVPSTNFHGARLRLHNTQAHSLPYRLRYTAKDDVTGKSMVFRTQNRTAQAGEEATAQYPLPALHPLTGNRWTLTSLEVQVQSPKLPADFELSPLIVELVLFEDTLK